VVVFAAVVVVVVALIDLGVLLVVHLWTLIDSSYQRSSPWFDDVDLIAVGVATGVTFLAMGLATTVSRARMRRSGARAAEYFGAVEVPRDVREPRLRRLCNVVEEVAVASGVAVPRVFLLSEVPDINAFTVGWSANDAAIAVTRGAVERLDRRELQGVVAHEISHILNGDMRLNTQLIGPLYGLVFVGVTGRLLARAGVESTDSAAGVVALVLGGLLVAVGYLGVLGGRVVRAAVAREREFLADASGATLLRQTSGLIGALAKIGAADTETSWKNPRLEEFEHMLFAPRRRSDGAFATHPPSSVRIYALDPHWGYAPAVRPR
jgi:Zn-dependent protease with chaperone function